MKLLFLSRDDIDEAAKHGISVLHPSDAGFAEKCRPMGLDPGRASSPHAVMLDCKLRDWFLFIIALPCGGGAVCFMRYRHSPILLFCLAIMIWLCWRGLFRRHRLIFADDRLYVGRFTGLRWRVDEIKAEDGAELYGEWVHRGKALKVRVGEGPRERHILLFPSGTAPGMTVWIAALFLSWKMTAEKARKSAAGSRPGRGAGDLRETGPRRV